MNYSFSALFFWINGQITQISKFYDYLQIIQDFYKIYCL